MAVLLEGLQSLCVPQVADNVPQVEVGTWAGALQEQTQLWLQDEIKDFAFAFLTYETAVTQVGARDADM